MSLCTIVHIRNDTSMQSAQASNTQLNPFAVVYKLNTMSDRWAMGCDAVRRSSRDREYIITTIYWRFVAIFKQTVLLRCESCYRTRVLIGLSKKVNWTISARSTRRGFRSSAASRNNRCIRARRPRATWTLVGVLRVLRSAVELAT